MEIEVYLEGHKQTAVQGDTIAGFLGAKYLKERSIVASLMDYHLVGLNTRIRRKCSLHPVHAGAPLGRVVLKRTVSHMLHSVVADLFPDLNLVVGQSFLGGHYYEIESRNGRKLDAPYLAEKLTAGMDKLADANLSFDFRHMPIDEAREALTDPGGAKASLLEIWTGPLAPVVILGNFVDIPHGPYALTTGCGKGARVIPYESGLILQFPDARIHPRKMQKLWACYRQTRDWNRNLGMESVGNLNQAILSDHIGEVIRISEALHEKRISQIADEITQSRDEKRVICIAGPSSAGKTTFVRRLSIQLKVNGVTPKIIGMDDYFLDREVCPRDKNGDFDFESLGALNLDLIHEHLEKLLKGFEVRRPHFDFVTGRSTLAVGEPLRLEENQVLLIEGIHGLNPLLTKSIPASCTFKVFTNALTQLVFDAHNRILTSDTRLLRRIVRDRLFRGTSTADTIAMWDNVRLGEKRHIFPFQEQADATFNSSLVYERAVLKTYAARFLLEVPRRHPSRAEAHRLLKDLELFVPIVPMEVPSNSVLREFIGGSAFNY